MNSRAMILRYFNVIFLLMVCSACGNCTGRRGGTSMADLSALPVADTAERGIVFRRDSLYARLMAKPGMETGYAPVIRFLLDSLVPRYNEYEYPLFSSDFLPKPGNYLTRMELDGLTLVTLNETVANSLHYFLLSPSGSIVWHHSTDVYRTRIPGREFRDWDGDGKKETVERRENIVSGFVGTYEYVFSVGENRLRLLFCIELSLENYIGADSLGGHLTRRDYKRLGNGLFCITQRESRCNGEGKPRGKVSVTRYTISADSLIRMYKDHEN